MTTKLNRESFEAETGSSFTVKLDDENHVEIELIDVTDLSNEHVDGYSLLFRATHDVAFGSHTHNMFHDSFGDFQMFITPVNEIDSDGRYFESTFVLLKES